MKQPTCVSTMASLFFAAAACSGASGTPPAASADEPSAPSTTASATPTAGGDDGVKALQNDCPMAAADVAVQASDTPTGVALDFTTGGDVADLRRRVQSMAERYGQCDGQRGMMWHRMGGSGMSPGQGPGAGPMRGQGMGPGHGPGAMRGQGMGAVHGAGPMPAADAKVEELDRGARIVLTPRDASQLDALRQHVHMQQERMQSGECWMIKAQGGSTDPSSEP